MNQAPLSPSSDNVAAAKARQTDHLAAAMPFNANKALEDGLANATQPHAGQTAVPE